MNIVFLDIDGVLNNMASAQRLKTFDLFDQANVAALNRILEVPDTFIVVSSAWRVGRTIEKLQEILTLQGVQGLVYDVTPRKVANFATRADEIQAWLRKHPEATRFVVLDDSIDGCDAFGERFIKTSHLEGLTEEQADRAVQILAGGFNPKQGLPRSKEFS